MERGPLALFGAIVAVGVGPALWMGVQLGGVQVTPTNPPVVSEQRPVDGRELLGGSGAGAPDDASGDAVIDTEPQGKVLPLSKSPSAEPSPSASSKPEAVPAGAAPTVSPQPSRSSGTGGDDPTGPPTESTTQPTGPADPPTDGAESDEPTDSPEPPTDGDPAFPGDPTFDDGDILAGR